MTIEKQTARNALLGAFADLALSRRYQDFSVGVIARRANVARSTFYYHFKAKDDLLLQNLRPLICALARLPAADAPTQDVDGWVGHIWEHRSRARRMFEGATGRRIADALALELRSTLAAATIDPALVRIAPLLADQIAGAMLSLLRGWVAGRAAATPREIADLLWSGARALAQPSAPAIATAFAQP